LIGLPEWFRRVSAHGSLIPSDAPILAELAADLLKEAGLVEAQCHMQANRRLVRLGDATEGAVDVLSAQCREECSV